MQVHRCVVCSQYVSNNKAVMGFGLSFPHGQINLIHFVLETTKIYPKKENLSSSHAVCRESILRGHLKNMIVQLIKLLDILLSLKQSTYVEASKTRFQGIYILVVGLGDQLDKNGLYMIATHPYEDSVFLITNYDDLSTISKRLKYIICNSKHLVLFYIHQKYGGYTGLHLDISLLLPVHNINMCAEFTHIINLCNPKISFVYIKGFLVVKFEIKG